ncbi:MAG: LlaMI family restriction endonuclease [Desulfovibrionaceae bacterium]
MTGKDKIIKLFRENVKGKKPNIVNANSRHDGRKGHWLEQQFGIKANADNNADLFGYELKNETFSKTTFGDWSANLYIFTHPIYKEYFIGNSKKNKQDSFCAIFGKSNKEKNGRYSWSGEPCPKIFRYNDFGQKLIVEEDTKDIMAIYSYSKDKRDNKSLILPKELQKENLVLAHWYGCVSPPSATKRDKCLKEKLESKFNQQGWFTCKTNSSGVYDKICFGKRINYDDWLCCIKTGIVFFDSGMYEGNARPYSQWRANNKFWDSLIIDEYA